MTTTLTIRLPAALARDLKAKARAQKTNPSAILRRAAVEFVQKKSAGRSLNAMQQHLLDRAGKWDGHCSGEDLLKRTRP
jgi:hypothetical protein